MISIKVLLSTVKSCYWSSFVTATVGIQNERHYLIRGLHSLAAAGYSLFGYDSADRRRFGGAWCLHRVFLFFVINDLHVSSVKFSC